MGRMAVKEWFRQLQPVQLYLMLGLTMLFFLVQLVMSHMTHALTLLVDAYHTLCNLIALTGCIITIKYGSASLEREEEGSSRVSVCGEPTPTGNILAPASSCYIINTAPGVSYRCTEHHHHHHHASSSEEKRLKNTFGWARIDVLVMLIGCVFLASLCFSVVVEALQTLVHIDHHDEMHHPIPVMYVGATGLLINGLCFLLIGGYTFHQGSFLHVTPSGDVVLDRSVMENSLKKGQRRLSAETRHPAPPPQYTQRQGIREMCRDISGCVLVIICSLIVNFTNQDIAKFVDPAFSILSAILLLLLSYPYMRESGFILLQTIPDTINIDSLRSELLKAFPDIVNVHDLHIWRLTATKIFSTAHIIFLNSKDYVRITKEVTDFFHDQGITQVTIQPEFLKMDSRSNLTELPNVQANHCLVQCRELGCHSRHCCSHNDQELVGITIGNSGHHHHTHSHNHHHHPKNDKKNPVAVRVKELVTHKKTTKTENQPELAATYNTNRNSEIVSNGEESKLGSDDENLCDESTQEILQRSAVEHTGITNPALCITEQENEITNPTEMQKSFKNAINSRLSENTMESNPQNTDIDNTSSNNSGIPNENSITKDNKTADSITENKNLEICGSAECTSCAPHISNSETEHSGVHNYDISGFPVTVPSDTVLPVPENEPKCNEK
ncbi:hypothetical protein C0J52_01823 [Blattella germanica]|nr:hypothetical protein C0J52_01823 [Blattella germanica]